MPTVHTTTIHKNKINNFKFMYAIWNIIQDDKNILIYLLGVQYRVYGLRKVILDLAAPHPIYNFSSFNTSLYWTPNHPLFVQY